MKKKIIGIVGGVGPAAGVDLAARIIANTAASKDQEHISFILASLPTLIEDRTEYLSAKIDNNPAYGIFEVIKLLEKSGATVIGIPCNTAHAPKIFNKVLQLLNEAKSEVRLINMLEETFYYIKNNLPGINEVGVLSTKGAYSSGIFKDLFKNTLITLYYPDENKIKLIHEAIYNEKFGIKAVSNPVTERAKNILIEEIKNFHTRGIKTIILGCTEIPLAIPEKEYEGVLLINPSEVLARKLIAEVDKSKLARQ